MSVNKRTKEALVRCNALMYGDFTLASGKKSEYYIDIKKASTDPYVLETIADEMAREIQLRGLGGRQDRRRGAGLHPSGRGAVPEDQDSLHHGAPGEERPRHPEDDRGLSGRGREGPHGRGRGHLRWISAGSHRHRPRRWRRGERSALRRQPARRAGSRS